MTAQRIAEILNQAVGSHEAAAIMGVHFSVPQRMADKGWISCHPLAGAGVARIGHIYDGAECNKNFLEYEEFVASRGGMNDRRPRAWLHHRNPIIQRLAKVPKIAFADCISIQEAAEILGVHPSFVPRMLASGVILGRRLHSRRLRISDDSTRALHICSRTSCLENARKARKMQHEGVKVGRPRNFS